MKILSQLEQLSAGPIRFSAIQTDDARALLERFKDHAHLSGKAMYYWRVEIGLAPLGIKPIVIPNTYSLEGALHYIADSRHYGIYLLCGINDQLYDPRIMDIIQKIQSRAVSPQCHIIVLDNKLSIPAELRPSFKTVRLRANTPAQAQSNIRALKSK